MKKGIKIILIAIMVLGIAVSIANFISLELKASSEKGLWVEVGGDWECKGDGDECDIVDDP
jgi:hypothetical protein